MEADPFQTIDQNGVGQLIQMAVVKGRSTRGDLKIQHEDIHPRLAKDSQITAFSVGQYLLPQRLFTDAADPGDTTCLQQRIFHTDMGVQTAC